MGQLFSSTSYNKEVEAAGDDDQGRKELGGSGCYLEARDNCADGEEVDEEEAP